MYIISGIEILCLYCFATNLWAGKIIKTFLWSMPTFYTTFRLFLENLVNKSIVTKMELHENGRFVDVYMTNGRKILNIDISTLSTLDKIEYKIFSEEWYSGKLISEFYPVLYQTTKNQEYFQIPNHIKLLNANVELLYLSKSPLN